VGVTKICTGLSSL